MKSYVVFFYTCCDLSVIQLVSVILLRVDIGFAKARFKMLLLTTAGILDSQQWTRYASHLSELLSNVNLAIIEMASSMIYTRCR